MKGPYTHQPSGLQTAWQSAPAFLLGRDGLNNDGVKFFKAFQSLLRDEDESNEEGDDRPSQSLKKKKKREGCLMKRMKVRSWTILDLLCALVRFIST